VKEAWESNWTYTGIDAATDTIIEGRKSIRINAVNASSYVDLMQDVYGRVKAGTWYTLSFCYFATQAFNTFIFSNSNSYACIDQSAGIYIDGVLQSSVPQDGNVRWAANWQGNRHTITFKTKSSFDTTYFYIIFRAQVGGQVAICMPKLEIGEAATAYMAHEDDLQGADGQDGVSITSADVMFGLSTSETTAPSPDNTTTWKTSIAALSLTNSDKNKYIWQCTKITYSNSNTVYTGKMCLGIVSSFADIVEQYALGTASAATGTWQDTTPPAMANGYYLWTRTKLVYSDNSVSYAPSANGYCVGYYGIDGTSITGANVWYALSSSNITAPQDSAFTLDDFPTTLNAGYYVWEATKITFSTGSPIFTGKMCLGATSDFLSGTEVYAISTSNSTAPAGYQFDTTYSKTKGYHL
jgi:hypothetical protein